MRLFVLVMFFLVSFVGWSKPQSVEVWFLSADGLVFHINDSIGHSEMVASKDCIPMGEGCFHPQLGYIEEGKSKEPLEQTDRTVPEEGIDLIECQEKDYFNIFCKTKRKEQYFSRVEVWIDYSSSLRILDPSDKSGACQRSTFIRALQSDCPKGRIDFSIFNTSKKQLGVPEDACTNYGTNNTKKLIQWIEGSSVKKLYIITDIDEHNRELKEYLDSIGAVIKGVDFGAISAAKLPSLTSSIVASCKKIKAIKK